MRNLKFRVWDFDENRMVYFEGIFNQRPCINTAVTTSLNKMFNSNLPVYEPDHKISEVMQYTGFKDKDGREIYFDDIVYDDTLKFNYLVDDLDSSLWRVSVEEINYSLTTMEICGNKHEHPSLYKNCKPLELIS